MHLGHAYSALCNARSAAALGGALRLRIEDTDPTRSTRAFELAIRNDLAWLNIVFDGEPRRQSDHLADYRSAFDSLKDRGLVYPCYCTRGKILAENGRARDPDGGPLHARRCADPSTPQRLAQGEPAGWRLDASRALDRVRAPLIFAEYGEGEQERLFTATPKAWGDILLVGRERPVTYHLAVVVDDAIEKVTDVMRGQDLFAATSIHLLLQALLDLPTPRYRHHRLVLDQTFAKMSKSAASEPLAALRERGLTAEDLRAALGFSTAREKPFVVNFS